MSSIVFNHVDFQYDEPFKQVFSDFNLVMDTTWRTGLVGPNGEGKSTLLNLLAKNLVTGAGSIDLSERTRYFPAKADGNLCTREVIRDAIAPFSQWQLDMDALLAAGTFESIAAFSELQEKFQRHGGYHVDASIEREFTSLNLDIGLLSRPYGELSGGERTRALLVGLFVVEGVYPLIDEPTNHLDLEGRYQVATYLASKSGFLLVSHDREFLDQSVDHIVSIDSFGSELVRGNYSSWRQHRDGVELYEQKTRENLNREVKQLKRAAVERRSGADAREAGKYRSQYGADAPASLDRGFIGHKAAKQMKRALSAERRIDGHLAEKESLTRYRQKERKLLIETNDQQHRDLIVVNDISHGFDGKKVLNHLSFNLAPRQRIAVTGPNGSGKSTLLRLLSRELSPDQGVIATPGPSILSFSYQEPVWCSGLLADHLRDEDLDAGKFRQVLGSFGVKGNVFEQRLESFSQGQLKKIDLARSMVMPADVLIWDEPMNYIDVFSREQIETAILDSKPTMIFVEHDSRFVERVATDVIRL